MQGGQKTKGLEVERFIYSYITVNLPGSVVKSKLTQRWCGRKEEKYKATKLRKSEIKTGAVHFHDWFSSSMLKNARIREETGSKTHRWRVVSSLVLSSRGRSIT